MFSIVHRKAIMELSKYNLDMRETTILNKVKQQEVTKLQDAFFKDFLDLLILDTGDTRKGTNKDEKHYNSRDKDASSCK